MYNMYFRI